MGRRALWRRLSIGGLGGVNAATRRALDAIAQSSRSSARVAPARSVLLEAVAIEVQVAAVLGDRTHDMLRGAVRHLRLDFQSHCHIGTD